MLWYFSMRKIKFYFHRLAVSLLLLLGWGRPLIGWADDPNDLDNKKHYWDGNQLSNQSRLGQAFDGFETEEQRRQSGRTADEYLAKIREQSVQQQKADQ